MRWLTQDWHKLLLPPWNFVALVAAAVACGALVGIERERKAKPVSMRTLALVSLGAAVFTLISAGFGEKNPEALRIAPQVVSGIGFLGAGVILRGQFGITGLTSAATIWAVAAAGMVVGTGYGGAGLALSLFMVGLLWLLSALEQRYIGPCRYEWARLRYRAAGGKTSVKIQEVLDEYRIPEECRCPITGPTHAQQQAEASGGAATETMNDEVLRLCYCRVHRHHREFLARLAEMPEIEEIRRESTPQPGQPRRAPRRLRD
ncbi:MAG: MgtC/SapB family protein [Verrucomicrobia bacterium]|nr:MgtC/SapB family protein [Verrucomicrobiota bacterium]MBV9659351.1 MgtC/SapB family protein [Verrucomicrobiota bacterium]